MNNQITVSDLIKILQTVPPDAKVRVMTEVVRNHSTTTEFVDVVSSNKTPNIDCVDGIYHWKQGNTIDFGTVS
jgi:hypothetical protein